MDNEEDPGLDPTHPHLLEMDETFQAMVAANRRRIQVPRKAPFSRAQVVSAFSDAFELIGGVPRFAHWAHHHPGDFYRLYAKMLPAQSLSQIEQNGKITIEHVLAPGPLDGQAALAGPPEKEAIEGEVVEGE